MLFGKLLEILVRKLNMSIKQKNYKFKDKKIYINCLKILLIALVVFSFLINAGCQGIFFIPGASYGYYIWEDSEDNIHIAWSIDRKESVFSGWIATDGKISKYNLSGWEENDNIIISEDSCRIEFNASLDENDYSDEIILVIDNYSYLEFDLRINDGYDLSRINIGEFINNPNNNIFRIEKDYFSQLDKKPWYREHPLSGLFYKLSVNIIYSLAYIFLLGIIIIEILRITVIRRSKKYWWYIVISYCILILIDSGVYLFLTKLSFI